MIPPRIAPGLPQPPWRICLLNLAVGLPVTFTLLAWSLGTAQQVLALVALSAVCTLGSSLLLWLPLWWLVGWLTRRLYRVSRAWWAIAPETPLPCNGEKHHAWL